MICYFNIFKQIQVSLSSILTVGSYSLACIFSEGGKDSTESAELYLAYWGLKFTLAPIFSRAFITADRFRVTKNLWSRKIITDNKYIS